MCGLARARRTAAAGLARTAAASTTAREARQTRPPRSPQVCTRIRTTRPNTSPPTTLTRSGPPPKRSTHPLNRSPAHPNTHSPTSCRPVGRASSPLRLRTRFVLRFSSINALRKLELGDISAGIYSTSRRKIVASHFHL